jgi:hypothetical protein
MTYTSAETIWETSAPSPNTISELEWHQSIFIALMAGDVFNFKRSEQHHDLHLRFVHFLVYLPDEGVLVTRDKKLLGVALDYITSGIVHGFLIETKDHDTGKTTIRASERLERVISVTSNWRAAHNAA